MYGSDASTRSGAEVLPKLSEPIPPKRHVVDSRITRAGRVAAALGTVSATRVPSVVRRLDSHVKQRSRR